jgi:hypothetical protein
MWQRRYRILDGSYSLQVVETRTMSVEAVAAAIRFTPQFGFRFGRDYLRAIPAAVIPSTLWPNKPQLTLDQDFTYAWAQAPRPSSIVPPSFTGDLYVNFAYAGVIVGWLLIGLFVRWIASFRTDNAATLTMTVILLIALLYSIEATITQAEVLLIQQGVLTFVALAGMAAVRMPRRLRQGATVSEDLA